MNDFKMIKAYGRSIAPSLVMATGMMSNGVTWNVELSVIDRDNLFSKVSDSFSNYEEANARFLKYGKLFRTMATDNL